jgi:hypothetical protein
MLSRRNHLSYKGYRTFIYIFLLKTDQRKLTNTIISLNRGGIHDSMKIITKEATLIGNKQ